MAINTQSDMTRSKEFDALQTILTAQGNAMNYEDVASLGRELLDFFEALGEENEQANDDHA